MTDVITGERLGAHHSPYQRQIVPASELGLPGEADIITETWTAEVSDDREAKRIFHEYGAVILGPDFALEIDGHPWTVGELSAATTDYVVERLQTLWGEPDHEDVIRKKDFVAYNGTERHLTTISPENVIDHFPDVTELQKGLLPTVRTITGDPETEISVDADEGTVINLQLFVPEADPSSFQQHGAHTDRVDITTVLCLDNIGKHGELVFVHGYSEACRELGLDPHRDFDVNLKRVLDAKSEAVVFRVHDVRPGNIVMIKSAEDVHFITAKSLGDVRGGLKPGKVPNEIGGLWLGRGIINAAFETKDCRDVCELAHEVVDKFKLNQNGGEKYFAELDKALATVSSQRREAIRNAIITMRSATDLYQ